MTRRPFEILYTTAPGNSQVIIPIDSTWWFQQDPSQRASISTSSAYLAPGPNRGKLAGAMIRGVIKVGNQAVTIYEQALTGNAGTSADWETESAGTIAGPASTTIPIEWKCSAPDWRLRIDAGGTGPNSIVVALSIFPATADYGS